MYSPRHYHILLRFNNDGENIDDTIFVNNWKKNGELDFSFPTKFKYLKYDNSKSSLSFQMQKTGYLKLDDIGFDITTEFALSFWFKISKHLVVFDNISSYNNISAPLISWGENSKVTVLNKTLNDDKPYGINITLNGFEFLIPYDIIETLEEWNHILINKDTKDTIRIFINGIKFLERKDEELEVENFTNIIIGNNMNNLGEFAYYHTPMWISIDEVALCASCISIDSFYPYPKYLEGFYPATEIIDTSQKEKPTGKTRYDNINDSILITRPVYFNHTRYWEKDMVTKYRFSKEEPFATSHFNKWMPNVKHQGEEYRSK